MFIQDISEWVSDGSPTELAAERLQELNTTGWLSTLPENGWILIGEKYPFGVCAFYDDGRYSDKTIYEMKKDQDFKDFGIPQSYACWITTGPYIYEAFTRKPYKNLEVGSSILFLCKCYLSNKGQNLVAPSSMSEDADLLYKNVCDLYGEPYKMNTSHIIPMPEKLFTPFGGKFVRE